MLFGLSFLPDADTDTKSARDYFADALALSDLADQAGLHAVKMTEHYLHPYGGYCPSPLSFLSAVAARTRSVRLLTGCLLPVFHHPVQLAAETAMLDALSDGRAEIGFARAYLPYEFDAFSVPLDDSRDRYGETIKAVVRLWTQDTVSVSTAYFSFSDARSLPRPVQKPHPPVWGAAVRSRQSFAWLGEQGFSLLVTPPLGLMDSLAPLITIFRGAAAQVSPPPSYPPQVAISLPLFLASSDREARADGERYLRRYFDVWADATASWDGRTSRDYPGYAGIAHALRHKSTEDVLTAGAALFGGPGTVLEGVERLRETLGVDQILWQVDFGAMPFELARRTVTLFVDRVLPKVGSAPVGAGAGMKTSPAVSQRR
jgi:alkanesulfonate monooxygenase SsuD/methylene tetrahydromethanopterin reductase-like flavin-dependent oxidoreductase (luciferase family)